MKHEISLGYDPEVMLVDAETGRITSAIPVLGHNKHDPIDLGDGIKIYSDNTLLEMAAPPAFTVEGAVERLQEIFRRTTQYIGDRYRLACKASHVFDNLPPKPSDELVLKWLNDLVPFDAVPEEWQVGCKPNWCAYHPEKARPQKPFQDGLRTGSFHIHIGNVRYDQAGEKFLKTYDSKIMAIKLMDIFAGCASIVVDKDETAPARKALYGQAGEFRETKYGIEYRVLGNFCLRTPQLAGLALDLAAYAMFVLGEGYGQDVLDVVDEGEVRLAIDTSNADLAKRVLCKAALPHKLFQRIEIESVYNPQNFLQAWRLQ